MGDLDVLTVTLALAGMVVLYGAIKNKNPLDVLKLTLQGKDLKDAAPLAGPNTGGATGVPTVPDAPPTPQNQYNTPYAGGTIGYQPQVPYNPGSGGAFV